MLKIYRDYPLAKLTTFRVGGKAEFFCKPRNYKEITEAFDFAKRNRLKTFILGGGANLLISDKGIKGVVISTRRLRKFSFTDETTLRAGSGLSIRKLNKILIKKGFSGLEFSCGLPGTLGGAVFMNARCYSREFSDVIKEVTVINEKMELEILRINDINYSYKESVFMKRENLFILDVTLSIKKGDKKTIKSESYKNLKDRKSKGQYRYPSAGCIFKNDYMIGIPSGKIIEDLGLKGFSIGGAEVYRKHANFIINKKKATPDDILNLIQHVEKEAFDKKGYKLEREVRVIGFEE